MSSNAPAGIHLNRSAVRISAARSRHAERLGDDRDRRAQRIIHSGPAGQLRAAVEVTAAWPIAAKKKRPQLPAVGPLGGMSIRIPVGSRRKSAQSFRPLMKPSPAGFLEARCRPDYVWSMNWATKRGVTLHLGEGEDWNQHLPRPIDKRSGIVALFAQPSPQVI